MFKSVGVILKIDMEKTYGHVDWGHVLYMMRRFGFGSSWCDWIWEFISLTSFLVLVNSSPSRLFRSSQGVRQGDPLSPFLLTLVVEALNTHLLKANECSLMGGF